MTLGLSARQRLLTVREVAAWLAISPAWVRDHASGRRRPGLPSIKLGKALRFDETDVGRWLDEMARFSREKGRAV